MLEDPKINWGGGGNRIQNPVKREKLLEHIMGYFEIRGVSSPQYILGLRVLSLRIPLF